MPLTDTLHNGNPFRCNTRDTGIQGSKNGLQYNNHTRAYTIKVHSSRVKPNRYILGRQALAAGDERKAEILFLEALDAEPTAFGGCAALSSALRQVLLRREATLLASN